MMHIERSKGSQSRQSRKKAFSVPMASNLTTLPLETDQLPGWVAVELFIKLEWTGKILPTTPVMPMQVNKLTQCQEIKTLEQ